MNTWATHTFIIVVVTLIVPVSVSFFYFAESKLANKVGAKIIMSRSACHVIKNMSSIELNKPK